MVDENHYHYYDSGDIGGNNIGNSNSIRRKYCQIQVIIVPDYNTESLLLLDLMGHLEECHKLQDPSILLHSQLFNGDNIYTMTHTMNISNRDRDGISNAHNATDHRKEKNILSAASIGDKNYGSAVGVDHYDYYIDSVELQKNWQTIKRVLVTTKL